jgi:hypothetical protein
MIKRANPIGRVRKQQKQQLKAFRELHMFLLISPAHLVAERTQLYENQVLF